MNKITAYFNVRMDGNIQKSKMLAKICMIKLYCLILFISFIKTLSTEQIPDFDSIFEKSGCITGVLLPMAFESSGVHAGSFELNPYHVYTYIDDNISLNEALQQQNPQNILNIKEQLRFKENQINNENDETINISQTYANVADDIQAIVETKGKTPISIINELSCYNQINPYFELVEEKGKSHDKTFIVILKLGKETYKAEGPSLKKAKQTAAYEALEKTNYKHPPEIKLNKAHVAFNETLSGYNSLASAELHTLAMKHNLQIFYTVTEETINKPNQENQNVPINSHKDTKYNKNNRYIATLRIGHREYKGNGSTVKIARQYVAELALNDLRNLTSSEIFIDPPSSLTKSNDNLIKSAISLVYEKALKCNLNVKFDFEENGDPHLKKFETFCRVGDFVTKGEGSTRKISKRQAAEKMLEELNKIPELPTNPKTNDIKERKKKKSKNLIKMKEYYELNPEISPISRLIHVQQEKNEKEPVFYLVEERGAQIKEFTVEVNVNGLTARGIGKNKYKAKIAAAEEMLKILGYSNQNYRNQAINGETIQNSQQIAADVKQIAPGFFLSTEYNNTTPYIAGITFQQNMKTISKIAKEYLKDGRSLTAENLISSQFPSISKNEPSLNLDQPKNLLLSLGKLFGFQVQFSDFPKANHDELFTLLSMTTNPPQICRGTGSSTEKSHDNVALVALRSLAKFGFDHYYFTKKEESRRQNDAKISEITIESKKS